MNKVFTLIGFTLLVFSNAVRAQCFYVQAGGGAGFVNGEINTAGVRFEDETFIPVVVDEGATVGAWTIGLGFEITRAFGVELNYVGYASADSSQTRQVDAELEGTFEMTTQVYQVNLLGVLQTPFDLGFGFYLKGKGGLGYVGQKQDITATLLGEGHTGFETKHTQNHDSFAPVLGVGIERDMSELIALSFEYVGALNNVSDNSAVYLALKFTPRKSLYM